MLTSFRRILSVLLLVAGNISLIWASLPARHGSAVVPITSDDMQLVSGDENGTYAVLEGRLVSLQWPTRLRIGDDYMVIMDFTSRGTDRNEISQATSYRDIYAGHTVMAEASYEQAGIKVDPAIPTRESLLAGQALKFIWHVQAVKAGAYDGVVWLSLRYLPLDGSTPSQAPVFVQPLRLTAGSLLGLSAPAARVVAGIGIPVGVLLEFSDIISLARRRKQRTMTRVERNDSSLHQDGI
ncbi:MAG: hypothetical protein ACM3H7_05100 [Acidobacteriaceae bacterium]